MNEDPPADDGVVVAHCGREVDLQTAPELRATLLGAIRSGARGVVADLSETRFCDSTVFSALYAAHVCAREHDVPYAIAADRAGVLRPLTILGLDLELPLYPDLTAARAAVSDGGERRRVS